MLLYYTFEIDELPHACGCGARLEEIQLPRAPLVGEEVTFWSKDAMEWLSLEVTHVDNHIHCCGEGPTEMHLFIQCKPMPWVGGLSPKIVEDCGFSLIKDA